jgi:hypothetical protein
VPGKIPVTFAYHLAPVEWAEGEIREAIKHHPAAENDLWHSYRLLAPTLSSKLS